MRHFRNFVDPKFHSFSFSPVALSVVFLLVYAKCNFASVLNFIELLFVVFSHVFAKRSVASVSNFEVFYLKKNVLSFVL